MRKWKQFFSAVYNFVVSPHQVKLQWGEGVYGVSVV